MRLAKEADASALAEEMDIPEELKRHAQAFEIRLDTETWFIGREQPTSACLGRRSVAAASRCPLVPALHR